MQSDHISDKCREMLHDFILFLINPRGQFKSGGMSSSKNFQHPRGDTEAEKTLSKRRKAEQKGSQIVESRSMRQQSQSSLGTNDGLGDAAASGK